MASITKARACEYFNYEPETGLFIVKERPKEEFDKAGYARHLKRIGRVSGGKKAGGYVSLVIDGKYYAAHRIAWLIVYDEWVPYPEYEIDHKNGNRSDNRISNLRKVTKSENQRNSAQRVNNTSGVHGVNWKPKYNSIEGDGRWVARIWNGPRHVYLGSFKSLHEAAIARKAAERALGFTRTNEGPAQYSLQRSEKIYDLANQGE